MELIDYHEQQDFDEIEIEVDKHVYWGEEDDGVFIDWEFLPDPVKKEISTIQNDLKEKFSRCIKLIQQNRDCVPDELYG